MQKAQLPVGEDVTLTVDGGEYTAPVSAPDFQPISIPGYKRFSDISVSAKSLFFTPIDTVIPVGFGASKNIRLEMRRDDTFANYGGTVYDDEMNPLPEVKVTVADLSSVTDTEGHFSITVPLAEERQELPISLECHGYRPVSREDETPGTNLSFIMHRNG